MFPESKFSDKMLLLNHKPMLTLYLNRRTSIKYGFSWTQYSFKSVSVSYHNRHNIHIVLLFMLRFVIPEDTEIIFGDDVSTQINDKWP